MRGSIVRKAILVSAIVCASMTFKGTAAGRSLLRGFPHHQAKLKKAASLIAFSQPVRQLPFEPQRISRALWYGHPQVIG